MIAKTHHLSTKNITGALARISARASETKVVTVTLNPTIDRTLWVPGFAAGKTLMIERSATVAGGKGVNVSRAFRRLRIDSTATGFVGREGSGPYLAMLDREGIRHDFVSVTGSPRTNVTILSEARAPETHLREKGPFMAESALQELEEKLRGLLEGAPQAPSALVVLSGGLPPGLGPDTYARLIEFVHGCGARAALDASGEPLGAGLGARPDFIKPNACEVAESLKFFPRSEEDFSKAISSYRRGGIETIMISLGKDGIVFSRGARAFRARVAVDDPVNSVGSGDAALAGGIAGFLSGFPDEAIAGLACATGAANTLISGACVFRLEDVEKLLAEVELRPIE